MKLVNLTPHTLVIIPLGPSGPKKVEIPTSGIIARCATSRERVGSIEVDGVEIPVNQTSFGELEGLPAPQPDTFYIVSALAAQAAARAGRNDVLIVDDAIRDEDGKIIGARALARP